MERQKLRVNATAKMGEGKKMEILFGKHLIKVIFGNVFLKYKIFGCMGEAKYLTFDPQPSDTNVTSWIWTITKSLDTMTLECNGELLLNLKFAESDTVWCVKNWAGDVVDSLKFSPNDTASQQYQVTDKAVGKCFHWNSNHAIYSYP